MISRLGKVRSFQASLVTYSFSILIINAPQLCGWPLQLTAALGRPVTAQERNFLGHTGIQPLNTEVAPDQMRLFLFGQIALF